MRKRPIFSMSYERSISFSRLNFSCCPLERTENTNSLDNSSSSTGNLSCNKRFPSILKTGGRPTTKWTSDAFFFMHSLKISSMVTDFIIYHCHYIKNSRKNQVFQKNLNRQRDVKYRSLAFRVLDNNISAVHLRESFNNKKPQAGPIGNGARGIGSAVKFFKHLVSFRRRYTNTVIAY